jgi:hypothetical protein
MEYKMKMAANAAELLYWVRRTLITFTCKGDRKELVFIVLGTPRGELNDVLEDAYLHPGSIPDILESLYDFHNRSSSLLYQLRRQPVRDWHRRVEHPRDL